MSRNEIDSLFSPESELAHHFVGRDAELRYLERQLLGGGRGVVQVVGEYGTGKTALGWHFAQRHLDDFPAGVYHVYAHPDQSLTSSISERVSHPNAPYLLILDELDRRPPAELPKEILAVRKERRAARLLCIGRDVDVGKIGGPPLRLEGFSSSVETMLQMLLGSERGGVGPALETLERSKLFADETSKLLQDGRLTPREILLRLRRSIAYFGLVGPDGKPLRTGDDKERKIIADVQLVNDDLLREVQSDPSLLNRISSRRFEEFVAEVLDRLGYQVELTPAKKDGGFDIYAAKSDHLGRFLYLVECKQRASNKRVGVELVRALNGVVNEKRANAGILVTTSSFTRGAKEFQRKFEHQMKLTDYLTLQSWLTSALSNRSREAGLPEG